MHTTMIDKGKVKGLIEIIKTKGFKSNWGTEGIFIKGKRVIYSRHGEICTEAGGNILINK